MSTPADWTWHEEPQSLGWYAILQCWEPEEGSFPEVVLVRSLPLDARLVESLVAYAGPFPTEELAEAWLQQHDPDGAAFANTPTTPEDPNA